MNSSLPRNLQVLLRTEGIVAEMRLRAVARRLTLYIGAAVIGIACLAMLNLGFYIVLSQTWGDIAGAFSVAATDFGLVLVLAFLAARTGPSRELDLALDLRREAMAAVEHDAHAAVAEVTGVLSDLRSIRQTVGNLTHNPLDQLLPGVVLPLATALLRHLKKSPEAA